MQKSLKDKENVGWWITALSRVVNTTTAAILPIVVSMYKFDSNLFAIRYINLDLMRIWN